jgi:RNA 2',3'-cyclic 3'-phosphodiesterase
MAPSSTRPFQRLFFALWPDDEVRAALASLTGRLASECGGRVMAAANLHTTLAFLGNVPQDRVDSFVALADALVAAPFELPLDTVGYWRHNRIVWTGARLVPPALDHLAADMKRGIEALAWPVDDRRYAAHVTLLRDARRGPAERVAALPLWRVKDFALVCSAQGPEGVQYTPLKRWTLRA